MKLSLSSLRGRDRRALLVGLVAFVAYGTVVGADSYFAALGTARAQLETQRELLARELGMLEADRSIEQRLRASAAGFATLSEAMFSATDSLAAVSDLSSFLLDEARSSRVHVEHVESRSSSVQTEGLVTLMVMLRGRSDLEGLTDFAAALNEADRLIRIEQLSITRLPAPEPANEPSGAGPPDVQVLEFSALVTGYALPDDSGSREGVEG